MSNEKNAYLKRRYRNGIGIYILMLLIAMFFSTFGIWLHLQVIIHLNPTGLIFGIPSLGFGVGFGFYAIKTITLKIRSIRLIENGKSGIGRFIRLKTVAVSHGRPRANAHVKYAIVFRYTNDSGTEKECSTDYVFFADEIQRIKSTISIKYSKSFAVVVDLIKTFQEASDIAKQSGEEFLNSDRTLGTVRPKVNKFLNIARVAIIALIVIFIALLITSIFTEIMIFFYVGVGLLGAGFIAFGVTFAVLFFGKSKK